MAAQTAIVRFQIIEHNSRIYTPPHPPTLWNVEDESAGPEQNRKAFVTFSKKKMTREALIEPPGATFQSFSLIFHKSERVDKSQQHVAARAPATTSPFF